jgi:hypothetical protein
VNAAASTDRGTTLDTRPELFDSMFAVNVWAPFFLMQEAIKVMRREGIQGSIDSMSAMAGQPFIAASSASSIRRMPIGWNKLPPHSPMAVWLTRWRWPVRWLFCAAPSLA